MILNYGVLKGSGGTIDLTDFGRIDELALVGERSTCPGCPPTTSARWAGFDPLSRWRQANLAGDFTVIAPVLEAMYQRRHRQDGRRSHPDRSDRPRRDARRARSGRRFPRSVRSTPTTWWPSRSTRRTSGSPASRSAPTCSVTSRRRRSVVSSTATSPASARWPRRWSRRSTVATCSCTRLTGHGGRARGVRRRRRAAARRPDRLVPPHRAEPRRQQARLLRRHLARPSRGRCRREPSASSRPTIVAAPTTRRRVRPQPTYVFGPGPRRYRCRPACSDRWSRLYVPFGTSFVESTGDPTVDPPVSGTEAGRPYVSFVVDVPGRAAPAPWHWPCTPPPSPTPATPSSSSRRPGSARRPWTCDGNRRRKAGGNCRT